MILTVKFSRKCLVGRRWLAAGTVVVLMGCGAGAGDDDTTIRSGNLPAVPTPAFPGEELPDQSDYVTDIVPYTGSFSPRVSRAFGHWQVDSTYFGIGRFPLTLQSVTDTVMDAYLWSDDEQLQQLRQGCPWPASVQGIARVRLANLDSLIPWLSKRLTLIDTGGNRATTTATVAGAGTEGRCTLDFIAQPFESPVYIRRDRFWEIRPIEGNGKFVILDGATSFEATTTTRTGTVTEQTEAWGRSISATVGIDTPFSASIEGTLESSFSTSVSIEKSEERSISETFTGESGKVSDFRVWQLVERYTFTDEFGEPIVDRNYELVQSDLAIEVRGVGKQIKSTEF